MAADQRVSKRPVQQEVTRQVQDSVGHLVNSLWCFLHRKHGQTDVLQAETRDVLLKFTETKPEAVQIRSSLMEREKITRICCARLFCTGSTRSEFTR